MAVLASLTAAGGVVDDTYTDPEGNLFVLSRVFASGVYSWKRSVSQAATNQSFSASGSDMGFGTTLLQYRSGVQSADPDLIDFTAYASATSYVGVLGLQENASFFGANTNIGAGWAFDRSAAQIAVNYEAELSLKSARYSLVTIGNI